MMMWGGAELDSGNKDNRDTLKVVIRSKFLSGLFDHDFVDKHNSVNTRSFREMEEGTKAVARRAYRVLK